MPSGLERTLWSLALVVSYVSSAVPVSVVCGYLAWSSFVAAPVVVALDAVVAARVLGSYREERIAS